MMGALFSLTIAIAASLVWGLVCRVLAKRLQRRRASNARSAPVLLALSILPPLMVFSPLPGLPVGTDGPAAAAAFGLPEFAPAPGQTGENGADQNGAGLWFAVILAWIVTAVYALGVFHHAARAAAGFARVREIIAGARPMTKGGSAVLLTPERVPPFSAGLIRRRIIVPEMLIDRLSPDELDFVLRHEEHHHRRGDPAFFAILTLVETMFWFNPFILALAAHCRLEAEIDCDSRVIAAAPEKRRDYAQALVNVLKSAAGNALPSVPAVFSPRPEGDHKMRILEIMAPSAQRRKAMIALPVMVVAIATAPVALGAGIAGAGVRDAGAAPPAAEKKEMQSGANPSEGSQERLNAAVSAIQTGDYAGGIEILDSILDESSLSAHDRSTAYEFRAVAKVNLEDYAGALGDFQSALDAGGLSSDGESRTRYHIAQIYFQLGDYKAAIEGLKPAVDARTSDANAQYLLAAAYVQVGDYASAEPYARRAAELNPDYKAAQDLVRLIDSELGNG